VLNRAPPAIRKTISCDDVLREILEDGIWHWVHDDIGSSIPILDDLMRHVQYCALQSYTATRDDKYRAAADLPSKWVGINPNLAYDVLPSKPKSTRQLIHATGRIWHKSYKYGTNRLKGKEVNALSNLQAICTHCQQIESPTHLYATCCRPAIRRIRERVVDLQTHNLDRLLSDPSCPDWQRHFFTELHTLSFSPYDDDAEKCWNATLNPDDLASLLSKTPLPLISFDAFQTFRKKYIGLTKSLSAAAHEIELAQQATRARVAFSRLSTTCRRQKLIPSMPYDKLWF
jgi:hypothetical protein